MDAHTYIYVTTRIYIVYNVQNMFSQNNKILLVSSLTCLLVLWVILWLEHVADEFWTVGLPVEVGGLVIRSWVTFWVFLSGMCILTTLRAILKHTVERDVIRARANTIETRMTPDDVLWWVLWDVYEKIIDTSMILIAVLRFDIWFILFFVHMLTVFSLHWAKVHDGRVPRSYT